MLGLLWGAVLGAAYGAALLSVAGMLAEVGDAGDVSVNAANRLGAVWTGFVSGLIFGGMFSGAPVGLILGLLSGLLLVVVTWWIMRYPGIDAVKYRRIAGTACAAASLLVLSVEWAARGFSPSAFAFWNFQPGLFDGKALDFVFVAVIPRLAATTTMWWVGRNVADRYLNRSREPEGGTSGFTGSRPASD